MLAFAMGASYVALALAKGGYPPGTIAVGTLVVWWLVLVGLGIRLLPRAPVSTVALTGGAMLSGLALLTGLSGWWAADNGGAFEDMVRVLGYLGVFVLVILASPAGSARWWLSGLAIGITAVAVLAAGSRLEPSLFPAQELPTLIPTARARLAYPLNYWNAIGAVMAIGIVLLAWLGASARSVAGRVAATALVPAPALALYFTSSRGGALALAVGLVVLLSLGPARVRIAATLALAGAGSAALLAFAAGRDALVDNRLDSTAASQGDEVLVAALVIVAAVAAVRFLLDRPLRAIRPPALPRGVAILIAGVLVAALAVAVAAVAPGKRIDDFTDPPGTAGGARPGLIAADFGRGDSGGRWQFWGAAWDAFEHRPVFGIGAGGYETWWNRNGSIPYYIRDAHSLYLETAGELGAVGLLVLLGFLGAPILAAARMRGDRRPEIGLGPPVAVLACAAATAIFEWTWELPAAFVPLILVAAVLSGPAMTAGETRDRFGWGVVTLAVAWIAIIVAAISFLADNKIDDSREAVRNGELAAAADDARDARAIEPWAADPRLQLALVEERRGDLDAAMEQIRGAIERSREDWRLWLVRARLETRAGRLPPARRALLEARRLNPRLPLFAPRF